MSVAIYVVNAAALRGYVVGDETWQGGIGLVTMGVWR